jgi:hypothetical protein
MREPEQGGRKRETETEMGRDGESNEWESGIEWRD